MTDVAKILDNCVFWKPVLSTYEETYKGQPWHAARSTKKPQKYERTLPCKYITENADTYQQFPEDQLTRTEPYRPIDQEDLSKFIHQIDHELEQEKENRTVESNEQRDKLESSLEDFRWRDTVYVDTYVDPKDAGFTPEHRGETCKPRKPNIHLGFDQVPKCSVTKAEFKDFSNDVTPELPIKHPCMGASEFPVIMRKPVVLTPEDEERFLSEKVPSKYQKNKSGNFILGPPERSDLQYKTMASDIDWPKKIPEYPEFPKSQKVNPAKIEQMTMYRKQFTGEKLTDLNKFDASSYPDPPASTREPTSGNIFWNMARADLKRSAKRTAKDPSAQPLQQFVANTESVDTNVIPQQVNSSNRIREGNLGGPECAGTGPIPYDPKSFYQSEMKEFKLPPTQQKHTQQSELKAVIFPEKPKQQVTTYEDGYQGIPVKYPTFMIKKR